MKKLSLAMVLLFVVFSLPLQAIIISDESIELQKIWEAQPSLQQKFKIFTHDARQAFPFDDEKIPHKAWENFKSKCKAPESSLRDRAICRVATHRYYIDMAKVIGIVTLIQVFFFYRGMKAALQPKPKPEFIPPPIPLNFLTFTEEMKKILHLQDYKAKNVSVFKILNIQKTATENDINRAFKKMAFKYHPDKHPNEKELYTNLFSIINQAKNGALFWSDEPTEAPSPLLLEE